MTGSMIRGCLLATLVFGCGTDPSTEPDPPDGPEPYPQLPHEPQRAGDPAAGYDYLVNGGYISCGIPKSVYDQFFGPAAAEDRLPGRTGDNTELPYSFSAATSAEGVRVVSANCLTCHADRINGELVVGLGAHARDFTSNQAQLLGLLRGQITDPMELAEFDRFVQRMNAIGPYTQTLTIGTNPADNLTAALMAHRDPSTLAWSQTPLLELPPTVVAPVDVPPWWRMARKSTMFYTGAGRGDHARIMMAASLLCTDTVEEAAAIDAAFVDVRAWISSLAPPAWPFPIDPELAAAGQPIFAATCARCHGTYGDGGDYPNLLVPLEDVATDAVLASSASQFAGRFVDWFAASFWGETSRLEPAQGYVAPPLDGIWATAPYFHNGSVPTIAAVLDSTRRPAHWTRTFESTDYDQAAIGWKFTPTGPQASEPSAQQRVRIYDTTRLGYGNGGHEFGDALSDDERRAVLEYLKTL